MGGRGVARGGQEGVLPRARTHYARTGPVPCAEKTSQVRSLVRGVFSSFRERVMPLVTGRGQLTGSAKGQCSHKAH
ncbi:hypothetical protein Sfr7A_20905 [Streptomyces xinghaiensis]|uniref:Uncharacterized protein n=1 Tax=Streptomyces xinghaiensis TaxID=1038928 RepID=A0A3R7ERA0_9ACTN|nr:hypothetical protein Sfr7A_20905 [Streptomyces xinghaiensis]RKM94554.1 hypothetical protein SFRA_018170 [Streptomyces xinghaiensis]RNC72153.1 hypothetical protein DC095_020370 [Streptomyces xinghaiensis]